MESRNLRGADLRQAILWDAKLGEADLSGASFADADLGGADLASATIDLTNFQRARMFAANLVKANIHRSNFSGADLYSARFGFTTLNNVDLSAARGLGDVEHFGPTSVGVDTLLASHGQIPDSFLRGCGVPDNFIAYLRSLTGVALEFYSCFISYSTRDQDFADRLYADLQARGVRCWFAPEDLKIGDKFRSRIDESIRIHDKLLLVLSENAIRSPWVEKEVEAAFERERREERTVLFPIRLDNAVMDTEESWAADIRRTRHIGDFTRWEQHAEYSRALERLLRDLKAEPKGKGTATPATPE